MTLASEDHDEAKPVGSLDDGVVANGTAGLNDGGDAVGGSGFDAIGEGEEGVRGAEGTVGFGAGVGGCVAHRVEAIGLSTSDTDGRSALRKDDGVGFDVFDGLPGKLEALHECLVALLLRHHSPLTFIHLRVIFGLNQQASMN